VEVEEKMPQEQQPPFLVVLDLSEDRAFSTLTLALIDYAETARGHAADESERETPNLSQIDFFNGVADAAEDLIDDVNRQLDELGKSLS
jgi:hypothetical protein